MADRGEGVAGCRRQALGQWGCWQQRVAGARGVRASPGFLSGEWGCRCGWDIWPARKGCAEVGAETSLPSCRDWGLEASGSRLPQRVGRFVALVSATIPTQQRKAGRPSRGCSS